MSSPCGVPGEVHAGGAVHCSPAKGRRGETHTTWGNAFLGLTMLQLTPSPAGLSLLLSRKKRIIKGCGFLAWFWGKKGFLGLQRAASEGHVGVQGVDVQVDLGDHSGHFWHPAERRQSPHDPMELPQQPQLPPGLHQSVCRLRSFTAASATQPCLREENRKKKAK